MGVWPHHVRFENRLEDDLRCRHDHPIGDSGNAEWPGLPRLARLWDVDPPQWLRSIGTGSKFCGEAVEEGPHRLGAPALHVSDGYTVDAGGSLVGGHVNPCPPHHITAGELVEEGMKATCSVLLGAAIKLRARAIGRSNVVLSATSPGSFTGSLNERDSGLTEHRSVPPFDELLQARDAASTGLGTDTVPGSRAASVLAAFFGDGSNKRPRGLVASR